MEHEEGAADLQKDRTRHLDTNGDETASLEPNERRVEAQTAVRAPVGVPSSAQLEDLSAFFEPLFAGMGGIDSWLARKEALPKETPPEVIQRLKALDRELLTKSQLGQLLILSHEAGPSEGFFNFYWKLVPKKHPYDVRVHGATPDQPFDEGWIEGDSIVSLAHLRWGMYRFYVDALLFFGNIRSAYRHLRDRDDDSLVRFFEQKRVDSERLLRRGHHLPLKAISRDDRYLVAENACKSLEPDDAGASDLERAILEAYKAHVAEGGSSVVGVTELISGRFMERQYPGRQEQFRFSADDILSSTVASEQELGQRIQTVRAKFMKARSAALENTRLYLSMVEDLDVYVATSMRNREQFRNMAALCDQIFGSEDLKALNIRYFDPTLSAAQGHVDKGLIECLMVDAAKTLVYIAGDKESLGKDFEAAMALSRGKPVIIYADNPEKERFYREVHPLTRLIEFDTGVAVGAIVTNSVVTVTELIRRLLMNEMEYEIHKTARGSLHLREKLTGSLVRLQTHDVLLQETFWNYYHHKGVLD
jgi:hypothetical protein